MKYWETKIFAKRCTRFDIQDLRSGVRHEGGKFAKKSTLDLPYFILIPVIEQNLLKVEMMLLQFAGMALNKSTRSFAKKSLESLGPR